MATNEKIKLDITSAFDPSGFQKANNAVRDLGGEMRKGGKVAGNLMDAFGAVPGPLGEVVNGVRKLGSAFSAGGWIALAAAGLAFIVVKFFEAKEAAAKLAEETRKAWREDQIKNIEKSLSGVKSKYALIADEIERGAKNAKELAKAYEDLSKAQISKYNAETDATVALMEAELKSKIRQEEDPNKKKQMAIDGEQKIHDFKQKAIKDERDLNEEMLGKKVTDAEIAYAEEKSKFDAMRVGIEEDKQSIEDIKSVMSEIQKKKPAPTEKDYTYTSTTGAGSVMGVGGGTKTFFDKDAYTAATAKWTKDVAEELKAFNEQIETVSGEIAKKESALKDEPKDLKKSSIERTNASLALDEFYSKDKKAQTANALLGNDITDKQEDLNKALEAQQESVYELYCVQQDILEYEEKIRSLKEKEADREDKRNQLIQNSQQAKSMGAAAWNQQQTAADDAQKDQEKADQKEANWVANAKNRMSTGAKLSERELARIEHFDARDKAQIDQPEEQKWQDKTNERIRKGFLVSEKDKLRVQKFDELQGDRKRLLADPGDPQKQMLTKVGLQLIQLEKLNTNLENSLKVN